VYSEELAAGICQISSRGPWNMAAWVEMQSHIEVYVAKHNQPVYLLLNLAGSAVTERDALEALMTAPHYNRDEVGLAVLVGRRGQLKAARAALDNHPEVRATTRLRLMDNLEGAFRVLLDRQVEDRLRGLQRYGG